MATTVLLLVATSVADRFRSRQLFGNVLQVRRGTS